MNEPMDTSHPHSAHPGMANPANSLADGPGAALCWLADRSFPDAANRSMATAAMVLTMGQLAGPPVLAEPPGFLLVRTSGSPNDPIDAISRHCLTLHTGNPTGDPKARDIARTRLHRSLNDLAKAKRAGITGMLAEGYFTAFRNARMELFGNGRAGGYATSHDPMFGWGVDESRHVLARLNDGPDRLAFLNDARAGADKLVNPFGSDPLCLRVKAKVSVAGSIGMTEFDEPLARSIVERSLPILILPHTATDASPDTLPRPLLHLSIKIAGLAGSADFSFCHPVPRLPNLPPVLDYHRRLAMRIHRFPPDYGFFVERTVREMVNLCWKVTRIATPDSTTDHETYSVFLKLCLHCCHAILLGVESLVWHGFGVPGHSQKNLGRLLPVLRSKPIISKREILRKAQWLRADERDRLLASLAAEGLVTIAGNLVRATPFPDFVSGIPTRRKIDQPINLNDPGKSRQ